MPSSTVSHIYVCNANASRKQWKFDSKHREIYEVAKLEVALNLKNIGKSYNRVATNRNTSRGVVHFEKKGIDDNSTLWHRSQVQVGDDAFR